MLEQSSHPKNRYLPLFSIGSSTDTAIREKAVRVLIWRGLAGFLNLEERVVR